MITIRLMRKKDADAVCQVDAAAFGAWWRQLKGETSSLPRPPGSCPFLHN